MSQKIRAWGIPYESAVDAVGITIANFQSAVWSDNSVYLAQHTRVINDMRRAGIPEA